MNVAALTIALRRKMGVDPDDGLLTPDVLIDLIDEANKELEAERDWPWRETSATITTVAGTASYAMPSTWLRTTSIRETNEQPLMELTSIDLDYQNPGGATGQPTAFAVYGSTLTLSPTPDAVRTFTHRYIRDVPQLAWDADEPLMPAMFHPAIVSAAAAISYERQGADQRAQTAQLAVDRWRGRMIDDQRRTRGPIRVRVRPGSAL